MKRTHSRTLAVLQRWKVGRWMLCATALLSFAAGSLVTARLTHLRQVRADSNRVFELMVYHTEPGKVPELESIFRDVSKLQAKHDLNVIGDPAFPPYRTLAVPLIEKEGEQFRVDEVYMRPTEYSALK